MKTRAQYLAGQVSHEKYYSQFVDETTKAKVLGAFGAERLLKSKDKHLNDLPMAEWDNLAGFEFMGSRMVRSPERINGALLAKLRKAGEGVSASVMVCIFKESARQIINQLKK